MSLGDRTTPSTTVTTDSPTSDSSRRTGLFWLGISLTIIGVILHLPMYVQARDMHYQLVGMPMSNSMVIGMIAIVIGIVLAAIGLIPRRSDYGVLSKLKVRAIDDAPIGKVHIRLLIVLAIAVTIDVMKPTTLAFVAPGMTKEYGLKSALNPLGHPAAALVPLFGITGTVIGSLVWGWLGDRIGRKAAMLLAGVIFVGTAICGAMPSFNLNLAMCFIMGIGAGGMLPVAFTLLSETIPARHRGWLMVLIGGDIAGAYIITSWLSETLTPTYSWRILWLIGLPTGVLFILLTRWVPESPRYLISVGREADARAVLREYQAEVIPIEHSELAVESGVESGYRQLLRPPFVGLTMVLILAGVGIGLVVYGFQLWLPTNLRHLGYSGVSADRVLRDSALIGFPLNFLVAYVYSRSTRWTLVAMSGIVAISLAGFVIAGDAIVHHHGLLNALLVIPIWASSSVVAVLAAYSTEVYPTRIRSRGSGMTAAMTKAGGVLIIALVVAAAATPSLRATAAIGAVPMALASVLAIWLLIETRHRRLEQITASELNVKLVDA
jgi:putative MFS transporter